MRIKILHRSDPNRDPDIKLLSLKAWARPVLEILSWVLLLFVIGFGIFWVFNWVSVTPKHDFHGFNIIGAVMGTIFTLFYGIPLGIMLKYLRSDKVKDAMRKGFSNQSRISAPVTD